MSEKEVMLRSDSTIWSIVHQHTHQTLVDHKRLVTLGKLKAFRGLSGMNWPRGMVPRQPQGSRGLVTRRVLSSKRQSFAVPVHVVGGVK
jgi:hypothetical protein